MLAPLIVGMSQAWAPCWASDEFLKNMRKATKVKEDPDKIEFYDRAIRTWGPGDGNALLAECHFRRGEARFRSFDFARADPDLSKAIELDPGNSQAKLLRGRVRLRAGRAADAVRDLADFTAMAPDAAEGFVWLGEAYLKDGQLEPALSAFTRAARLDPSDYRPPFGQGRAFIGRREWDKALAALTAADELAKHLSADVLTELGVCSVGRSRHQEALGHYDEALPLHERLLQQAARGEAPAAQLADYRDGAARAYYGRGRVNEFLARMPEASADFRSACELGHREACRRAEALAQSPAPKPKRKSAAAAEPDRRAPAPPKKKPAREPESEAGDRIYAN